MTTSQAAQKGKRRPAPRSVDARISERAYELWMERGIPDGSASEGPAHRDWLEAEEQILEDVE